MTPETKAHQQVDQKLGQAGRVIHDIKEIFRSEDAFLPEEIDAAHAGRVASACASFYHPALLNEIENIRREREQLIGHINLDQVMFSDFSKQAETQVKTVTQTFASYLKQHKEEISALNFFCQQPYQREALTYDLIEDLHEHLNKPLLMLTTERQLTHLLSLLCFALGLEGEFIPFADELDKRFQAWICHNNSKRGTAFTPEQTDWLRLLKEHIANSCSISRNDFDYAELADKGGLQKAWGLFDKDLDTLVNEMNMELVA